MALAIGTNCGFVVERPTADPGGTNTNIDTNSYVSKFTSPAGATKITEIGWYCDNATEAADYVLALYAADGAVVPGEAGTRLYITADTAKGTDAGWKYVTVDWNISAETDYWFGVQLDDTATATHCNNASSGGAGYDARYTGQTTLNNPYGGGVLADDNGFVGIYAVYETGGTYAVTYNGNGNTGGSAPTDANSPYDAKEEVSVLSNSGSLIKTGSEFIGWNTAANGSGTSYQYLDRFNMPAANVTLYAQWKINIPKYPAKTIVAGGQGTRADASDNNGGCFSSDSDYASFQGANGAALYTVAGCAYDTDTGKITKAGEFATGLEGVWVNTREGAAGAWVEKRYWIQASDANSITIGAGLGSNADIDVWVGGALKTLDEMLTEAAEASGGFDSGYNAEFDIHYGASIIKIDYPDGSLELQNGDSVTLDIPAGSGGAGSLINGGLINAI